MAPTFDPNGLLDVSTLRERDYAPLPKTLAAYKPTAASPAASPLFPHAPLYSDLDALLRVHAVDDSLHACFSSLLSGLSSGPSVVMGAFRALNEQEVVVRLHPLVRPKPFGSLIPIYLRVARSHAQLAVQKGWVPASTVPWLALYAAVYYSWIGDRKEFYSRTDLGGPDNAAWLVFYGKDSARALPDPDTKSESDDKSKTGKKPNASNDGNSLEELYAKVLAAGKKGISDLDDRLLIEQVFAAHGGAQRSLAAQYAKLWRSALKRQTPNKSATIAKFLTAGKPIPEPLLRVWLRGQKTLPADLRDAILLFLELNGGLNVKGGERYSPDARSLWKGIQTVLADGAPVVLELDQADPACESILAVPLESGNIAVSVLSVNRVDVADKNDKRRLRYLGLAASAWLGQTVEVVEQGSYRVLRREPAAKGPYPLDVEQALTRGSRLHVGANALAVLASSGDVPSFTIELPRKGSRKITWPKSGW